jgi:SNF2 family DNA or RNA helicase
VENRLSELRAIMDFCNPGILGSPERFRERFATPIERDGDGQSAQRLRAITRPYILRRVKTDTSIIDDLPPKIEMREPCLLTPEQATLYQAVLDDMMEKIATATGIERRGLVLATMIKLKQVCNHPAQFLHSGPTTARRSGKLTRLFELTDELLVEGDKALLFTQFTEFGDILVEEFAIRYGTEPAYLHGKVPKARRDAMVEAFQGDSGPPLFVLSLRAGGTGLNLTAANHVIHVDRWWNPAVENQATDRAFRIGQKRGVQVRKFLCVGTLEERIDAMIEEKKALADLVVGVGENWLTELSTAELREVFALSKEAVSE